MTRPFAATRREKPMTHNHGIGTQVIGERHGRPMSCGCGGRQYGVRTGDCCPEVPNEMIESTDPVPDQAGELSPREVAAWWTHARCNDGSGELTDVFFSGEPQDIARAKRLCLSCPALIPCLEGALERREPCGVWGGQLFVEGTIVATKRRRGRPPKVPRLEDQLPDVPLPEHLREVPVVRIA